MSRLKPPLDWRGCVVCVSGNVSKNRDILKTRRQRRSVLENGRHVQYGTQIVFTVKPSKWGVADQASRKNENFGIFKI